METVDGLTDDPPERPPSGGDAGGLAMPPLKLGVDG